MRGHGIDEESGKSLFGTLYTGCADEAVADIEEASGFDPVLAHPADTLKALEALSV